ncbi:hypothetical protein K1719_039537 [Acacia pycnantha]|nr:hypothetical protein K1719_039537 [Acacia pycnantha]
MAVTVGEAGGSKGGGDHGVKGHSPFVTFRSGPSGKTGVKGDKGGGRGSGAGRGGSDVWRRTGKLLNLQVNAEEYDAWCKPFMNSLIVKLLGKTVNVGFMRFEMERMWAAKGPLRVTPRAMGTFLFLSLDGGRGPCPTGRSVDDCRSLCPSSKVATDQPTESRSPREVAVWVRIPPSHELYNVESIRRIGNMIGKTLKIDRAAHSLEKGRFCFRMSSSTTKKR